MLGKLVKYEIKSTAGTFLLIYGVVLALAVINRIFYAFDFSHSIYTNDYSQLSWLGNLLVGLFGLLYVLMLIAMFVVVMIVVVIRFYKNMFGGEGYLMHTLPVTPWQHILSKMLTSALWMLGSSIVAILSFVVLLSHREIYDGFQYAYQEVTQAIQGLEFSIAPFIVEYVILLLIGLFTYALPIYACICIGQLWGKHRVLGAFCSYMILNFITSLIAGIGGGGFGYTFAKTMERAGSLSDSQMVFEVTRYIHSVMIFSLIFTVIMSALYFLICNFIMSRKLNLE